MKALIYRWLFDRVAREKFGEEEALEFERLYRAALLAESGEASSFIYDSGQPKHRFLSYLADRKGLVLHGSNACGIERFEPREQTLYDGRPVRAVFATADGIWPIFYAVFDRSKLVGSFRNGCLLAGRSRFYFFSLNEETLLGLPWTNGTVYALPADTFRRSGGGPAVFDEWISESAVAPLLRIDVSPGDFVFLDRVGRHPAEEPLWRTWLLHKRRRDRDRGKGKGNGKGKESGQASADA